MNCCVCLWVLLAAGAITVSGIDVSVLNTTRTKQAECYRPQPIEDSNLLHVECEGLAALQDVTRFLKQEQWPQLGSLTLTYSNLTTKLNVDDLVNYPALHTLTFKKSRLNEWRKSQMSSVPKVRMLVIEQCWDNDTFLAKELQLTLTVSSKLHDALPGLEELHLIDNFMPHIAEPRAMKSLNKFIIEKGAAECSRENLWLLNWYDAGKLEINSSVCFVIHETLEGLASLNILFSFVDRDLMQVLRVIKNTLKDCPVPCDCEVSGFQRADRPITIVDCTSANFTQLPDLIPSHTSTLIFSNNHVTNISKIFVNPMYRSLNKITLENNKVDHIDGELLCNYLVNHSLDFSINLIYNKLETLPVKHLERMYKEFASQGHKQLPTFNLAGNPWNCDDCAFLVPFQYLIFYQDLGRENPKEIRCGKGRHAEGQPIIMLPVQDYCTVDPPLEPLDILNICLGILLFLFILNFLHNLIQYQRHGKLPWIVTKFPFC